MRKFNITVTFEALNDGILLVHSKEVDMKKLILLIVVLFTALGAYVWYQGQSINPDDVLQINIYQGNDSVPVHSYYQEDQESILEIVGIFNNLDGSSSSIPASNSEADSYKLDIITDSESIYTYDLSIDLENLKLDIYDSVNEQYLTPSRDQIVTLLSLEGFYDLYETSAPSTQLTYSTITIPAQVSESNWVYQLVNGTDMRLKSKVAIDQKEATIPLHPEHPVEIYSEKAPTMSTLRVYKGEDLLREEIITDNMFLPNRYDGELRYEVTCQWSKSDDLEPYGTSTMSFYGTMDIEPELVMDKETATAGDVIVLEIFNINDDQTVRIDQTLSKDIKIWKSDDRHFAFLAMNYWAEPGDYSIKLIVENTDGTAFTKDYPVQIEPKSFKKQYLTVDKKVEASTRNDAAYEEYAKYFTPTRDESVEEKLWEGTFIQPTQGRISTEFGEMRYVNGSLTSYRHSGIDIAAPTGTEIIAPNHGIVKLSQNLILTGETIVIDHGYGIFSIYFHLNSRTAEVGQSVSKGELIGTVGSTGFSTGPHLHWTMSHYKTNLSPWLFLERELITFE